MTRTRLLLASVGLAALLAAAVTGMIYAGPLGQSGDDAPIPDHLERLGEIKRSYQGNNPFRGR